LKYYYLSKDKNISQIKIDKKDIEKMKILQIIMNIEVEDSIYNNLN
jgi:hypothetical protein